MSEIFEPSKYTSPDKGESPPAMIFAVVDFPAPFDPMSETISAGATESETSSTARAAP
jgi:hypothetical protein